MKNITKIHLQKLVNLLSTTLIVLSITVMYGGALALTLMEYCGIQTKISEAVGFFIAFLVGITFTWWLYKDPEKQQQVALRGILP